MGRTEPPGSVLFYSIIKMGFFPPDPLLKRDHLRNGISDRIRTDSNPRANNCLVRGEKGICRGVADAGFPMDSRGMRTGKGFPSPQDTASTEGVR